MTIEEAIKHCKDKAEALKVEADYIPECDVPDCLECAKEHEQLAHWLEELVEMRSQRSSEFEWCKGCKEHDEENHCCHRLSNFIHTQAQEIHDMAYEEGKNDRPQGEWISQFDYCKQHNMMPSGYGNFWWCNKCDSANEKKSNFCPNCGAKMEVHDEEA